MLVRLAAPLFRWLEQRPPLVTLILAGWLLACCGALDYLTGANVGLSIAYLLPICLVTWRLSRHAGLVAAVLSVAIWWLGNSESLPQASGLIMAWNASVRLGIFVIVIDILGSLRDALIREQQAARTDGLTGLLNRRAFEEAIELRLQRPVAACLALAYLDLDNFKALNDQRGHAAGDDALRAVAATLSAAAPPPALVARLGGDEFIVMFEAPAAAPVGAQVDRLRQQVNAALRERGWAVSASAGLVVASGDGHTGASLLAAADQRLYQAKRAGKNQIALGLAPAGAGSAPSNASVKAAERA